LVIEQLDPCRGDTRMFVPENRSGDLDRLVGERLRPDQVAATRRDLSGNGPKVYGGVDAHVKSPRMAIVAVASSQRKPELGQRRGARTRARHRDRGLGCASSESIRVLDREPVLAAGQQIAEPTWRRRTGNLLSDRGPFVDRGMASTRRAVSQLHPG
jgi:hypothetical protein